MTEVESVALWASLIVGIASVVLAVVAIITSLFVSSRDSRLSNDFSKSLGEIQVLSSQTQSQLNDMSGKVVDAFIDLRQPLEPAAEVTTTKDNEDGEELPSTAELELYRLSRRVQELEVRQRFQVREPQITVEDFLDEQGIPKPKGGVFTRFDLTKSALADPSDPSA